MPRNQPPRLTSCASCSLLNLVHALLNIGKDAIPFFADSEPVAAFRVVDDAATTPQRGLFNSQTARQRGHGATNILRLREVFGFDRDEALSNDRAEKQSILRLNAGRAPPSEFRSLHGAPVGMGKSIELKKDLAQGLAPALRGRARLVAEVFRVVRRK